MISGRSDSKPCSVGIHPKSGDRDAECSSIIVLTCILLRPSIFPDRDLDALCCEALAQGRALDHSRELLGREDLELIREGIRQDRCPLLVQALSVLRPNVNKVNAKTKSMLASISTQRFHVDSPEVTLRTNR
jgi:hypothetical protein